MNILLNKYITASVVYYILTIVLNMINIINIDNYKVILGTGLVSLIIGSFTKLDLTYDTVLMGSVLATIVGGFTLIIIPVNVLSYYI